MKITDIGRPKRNRTPVPPTKQPSRSSLPDGAKQSRGTIWHTVEQIFEDSIEHKASDIHLQPHEEEIVIKYRLDGDLHEIGKIPKAVYEGMLNRIKILARLRIDEHYSAQDGAIHHITNEGHKVDFRVSIVPTLLGECVALRVLGTYVRNLTLNELGLSTDHQRMITKTSKKPFGMIINTGPAGAGKTTTLYAILKILNRPEVGIITIEDPVEYKIPGIDQIEVNLRTNLTYADGLSSILRQDPNIILVGEIRDKKTAEIAVNAALTGHPLLSSFHANDAATAIPRMVDMGIEPFLLSSVLELVIAQRLVRKLCTHCRHAESVSKDAVLRALPDISGDLIQGAKTTRYTAKGCDKCNDTGYKGRTALFELLPISKEIRELILQRPNSQMIRNLARRSGLKTMFESGLEKVNNGETSLEELIRITSEYEET